MNNSLRRFTTTVVAALTAALLVAGVATATGQIDIAKKKKKAKPVLTSKQKKAIDKMIAAKIKKIPAAPVGPAAYSARNATESGVLPNSASTYTKVLDLAVPAGKYAVNGRVNVGFFTDDNTNTAFARCNLKDAAGNTLDDLQGTTGADQYIFLIGTVGYVNLSFNATLDAAAATTLSISCANANKTNGTTHDSSIGAGQARLTAVRVASVN